LLEEVGRRDAINLDRAVMEHQPQPDQRRRKPGFRRRAHVIRSRQTIVANRAGIFQKREIVVRDGIAHLSCLFEPRRRLRRIFRNAVAGKKRNGEIALRFGLACLGCFAEQFYRLRLIERDAVALGVHNAKPQLRPRMALSRCKLVPTGGGLCALLYAGAAISEFAERELRVRMPLARGLCVKIKRALNIRFNAEAVFVNIAEKMLGVGIARFRQWPRDLARQFIFTIE
jgi:hypothetical protein